MIVLAILLLAAAIALIVVVALEGGDAATVEMFGRSVDTTVLGVFLAGVITGLIFLAGVAVLTIGLRQAQARRREIEYLRQRVAEQDKPENNDDSGETMGLPAAGNWSEQRYGRRRPADMA